MENDIIVKFYYEVNKFIRSFSDDVNKDYTEEKIFQIIRDIPKIIGGFRDCTTEEEYRMMAKKSDGTLATIQVVDPNSKFKVYREISTEEYKNFYYECLMYSLILYELYWKNYIYEIKSDYNEEKTGELEITEKSLPHLLGIDSKYIGNCQLLENLIPGYNGKSVIEQIMLIIENHEVIKQYEVKNNIEIFNYYKSMQKVKNFLLFGRMFSNFDYLDGNKLIVLDNENSDNQLWLVKKSNMNSTMNRNIIKILLQKSEDGNFFPRSLQSISDEMEMEYLAAPYIRKGVEIESLTDQEKIILLNKGLLTHQPSFGISLKKPVINPKINPLIFSEMFRANVINLEDLIMVIRYLTPDQNLVLNKSKGHF